jgi:hypothetical protein
MVAELQLAGSYYFVIACDAGYYFRTVEVVVQHANRDAFNVLPVKFLVHDLIGVVQGSRVNIDNAELFSKRIVPYHLAIGEKVLLAIGGIDERRSVDWCQKWCVESAQCVFVRNGCNPCTVC